MVGEYTDIVKSNVGISEQLKKQKYIKKIFFYYVTRLYITSKKDFKYKKNVEMEQILVPINHVEDAPNDTYIVYKMTGGIYYCEFKNYTILSKYLSSTPMDNQYLTLDLSFTQQGHSLLFDIDVKFLGEPLKITLPVLLSYYDQVFSLLLKTHLTKLKHFTTVVAFREDFTGGMHVHLPECSIAHDDYIELCSQLQPESSFVLHSHKVSLDLDIVCNFSLVRSSKQNTKPYIPLRMYYYDERNTFSIDVSQRDNIFSEKLAVLKKKFKRRKDNENSLFRKFLTYERKVDFIQRLFELIMPVVISHTPLYRLSYSTSIVTLSPELENTVNLFEADHEGSTIVGTFIYNNRKRNVIRKRLSELCINDKDYLKCFKYLILNSYAISDFESNNRALNLWYKRSKNKCFANKCAKNIFTAVNQDLIVDNCKFQNDANPLHTILVYNQGYYFLPVFYALCKHLKQPSNVLVSNLRPMFNDEAFILKLLDKLERIEPKIIENVSQGFTLETIFYCGSNLREKKECRLQDKVRLIVSEMTRFLEQASTIDEMSELIRKIQGRHYPVMTANIRHSCKKAQMYNWNLTNEYWQTVEKESSIERLISVIWSTIMERMRKIYSGFEYSIWYERLGKYMNMKAIGDALLYETYQDRKTIEMDRHKWHIRTNDGILDLLTGHVGATVPEFYMSERKMAVSLNRRELLDIRDNRSDLMHVYKTLTDRRFFQTYLKCLFDDVTDDLLGTLLYLVQYEKKCILHNDVVVNEDDYVLSIYQFYVHLCKYTSFEYDRMMYMLDVIASLLVATNYMRKFFILKGVTKNGKSKFFQMISRVFGGYSYTARSVNLQNQQQGLQAMPELASSLFGCRVITIEELANRLNENLIKEITGNSATSFRNLYEQNSGGIPTAKIFASTNTYPECTATEAFKDRVVALPFDAKFCREAQQMTTAERVLHEKYVLETNDSVVEDSHKGFFIMAYLHLIEHVDPKDGMLHYREEPESLAEFKKEILLMTDIYVQFKQYMDVQIVPNANFPTTFNDLRSAIRYFLKNTKNSAVQETDLIMRFDEEFSHLKKMTFSNMEPFGAIDDLGTKAESSGFSILDQIYQPIQSRHEQKEDSSERIKRKHDLNEKSDDDICGMSKKTKSEKEEEEEGGGGEEEEESNGLVYYENVIIKNLSRAKHNR